MKLIILLLLSFGVRAQDKVVQHNSDYSIEDLSGDQIHFWGKVSSWSKWENSGRQDFVSLDKNPIYTAYVEDHPKYEVHTPDLESLKHYLGDKNGEDFFNFLSLREEIEEEALFEHSAIVYESKITKIIAKRISDMGVDLEKLSQILAEIDSPHDHRSVGIELSHNILEPLHSGHRRIDSAAEQKMIFSTVKLEEYGCDTLMGLLAAAAELQGEPVERRLNERGEEVPVFRLYSLNSLQRLTDSEIDEFSTVFGSRPSVVYSQEVIYSSKFLKTGKNFWALYDMGDQTKVVNYSVVAFTSKMSKAMGVMLNGVTYRNSVGTVAGNVKNEAAEAANNALNALKEKLGNKSEEKKSNSDLTEVTIDKSWVDLNDDNVLRIFGAEVLDKKVCSQGLGLGVPRYTLKNFNSFLERL